MNKVRTFSFQIPQSQVYLPIFSFFSNGTETFSELFFVMCTEDKCVKCIIFKLRLKTSKLQKKKKNEKEILQHKKTTISNFL